MLTKANHFQMGLCAVPVVCLVMSGNIDKIEKILTVRRLNSNYTKANLNHLKNCLSSCYSTNGRTKIIGKKDCEEFQVGSSSLLLLNSEFIDVKDNVIKLIVSCSKEHLKVYYDFGLYCILFSLELVESGLNSNLNPCLVAECYRHFSFILVSHLHDIKNCAIVKKYDLKMKSLLSMIQGILLSKPGLSLNCENSEKLSVVLLSAFLNSLPSSPMNTVFEWPWIVFKSNLPVDDSKVYDGILLDLHHYTKDFVDELFIGVKLKSKVCALVMDLSLTINDFVQALPGIHNLSAGLKHSLHKQFRMFSHRVLASGISVVFNQKLVCEELKYFLKTLSIVVVDRIGNEQTIALKRLTNAQVVSSLSEDLDRCKIYIDKVSVEEVKSKSYVLVRKSGSNVSTALVCFPWPYNFEDIKHVCFAAVTCLAKTMKSPLVLDGAPLMEMYLKSYLETSFKSFDNVELAISCSAGQLQTCLNLFCGSLKYMSNLITTTDNRQVLDCYESKLNAFKVAIDTACVALEITHEICD